jgi:hypothetical protein
MIARYFAILAMHLNNIQSTATPFILIQIQKGLTIKGTQIAKLQLIVMNYQFISNIISKVKSPLADWTQ